MNVCIIGWYGTETLGDRGILAGIISMLADYDENLSINLGSIYPFFSKRTIREDSALYEILTGKKIGISIFDSTSKSCLKKTIRNSDLLIMGGGPLMDLSEMYMVRYAFKYAKKNKIKSLIFGCGIGPLFHSSTQLCALDIIELSNYIVLRDQISLTNLNNLAQLHHKDISTKDIVVGFDPAVECIYKVKKNIGTKFSWKKNNSLVINLRDFPSEYMADDSEEFKKSITNFMSEFLCNLYSEKKDIILVPMHYFFIGNDDRLFFNRLCRENRLSNVRIQNHPLTLLETIKIFYESEKTIGMRFHSIVFQSIINGNNFILDYTQPKKGKIYGFMQDLFRGESYSHRYYNLQSNLLDAKNVSCLALEANNISQSYIEYYYNAGRLVYNNILKSIYT